MSSGELPLETYHRTGVVGSGTYGSVVVVYDDDGKEHAAKVFEENEDEDEDEDDDEDRYGIDLGALREISVLRLLRGENSHPNVIEMTDVQTSFGIDEEDDDILEKVGTIAMAMPLFPEGSLADAFSKLGTAKRQKALIAKGLLEAVAFLHENSIIHRDIKSDNVLLRFDDPTDSGCDDLDGGAYAPVLIDFSLAKIIDEGEDGGEETEPTHTSPVGTRTYRAPEVARGEPYGLPSDLYSVGIVLLELLRGKCLEAEKDRDAFEVIDRELRDDLPKGKPFPDLLRGLLEHDPTKRWTAREALRCDLFSKFGFVPPPEPTSTTTTLRRISLSEALPIEGGSEGELGFFYQSEKENLRNRGGGAASSGKKGKKKKKADPVLTKRFDRIRGICDWMGWKAPSTATAAMVYATQMNEITGDVDDLDSNNNTLLSCLVLAHKFFEPDLLGSDDLDEMHRKFGNGTDGFDAEAYGRDEISIFEMMDFCLYPR